MIAEKLQKLNPNIKIHSVNDPEFMPFGRVLKGFDATEIIGLAENKKMPESGSLYEASVSEFEKLQLAADIAYQCFGEMPIQIGYCYGHSNNLNGLEWHTSSEVNVAITDLVLFLGDVRDLRDNKINSSEIAAFYVEKGEVLEVYATTLHFCPCEVKSSGFGCVVALPKGTNLPLETESVDKFLFRKNKWIIAHKDNPLLINRGVVAGIEGENTRIKY